MQMNSKSSLGGGEETRKEEKLAGRGLAFMVLGGLIVRQVRKM